MIAAEGETPINALTADSRQVQPGSLFVAYRGVGVDSHKFIPDAVARGAAAIVGEMDLADLPVPYVRVRDGRETLALLNSAWYGHPSRDMILIGVTGTDGKTTTCNLLYSILRAAGVPVGLISTVNAVIGGEVYETGLHTTTPDAPDIQQYLARMRDAGTQCAVLEVTSHGLAQHRVTGCSFDIAVLTNVTHEHLDFHGTFEAYRASKALLFRGLTLNPPKVHLPAPWCNIGKSSIINRDDDSYRYFRAIPASRHISYGLRREGHSAEDLSLSADEVHLVPSALAFRLSIEPPLFDPIRLSSSLVGAFNVSNIMAAAGAALALDIPLQAIAAGVKKLTGIAGRMERIDVGQSFSALVDFAHTPNALQRAITVAREMAGDQGRVLVVFGCAGLRDRDKRWLMGESAARLADLVIITAEDPRTEDLTEIMAETARACAASGMREGHGFLREADRQRAICAAVDAAVAGDVVLICGKGHERSMCFGTTEYPWSDQEALRWALRRRQGTGTHAPPNLLPTYG